MRQIKSRNDLLSIKINGKTVKQITGLSNNRIRKMCKGFFSHDDKAAFCVESDINRGDVLLKATIKGKGGDIQWRKTINGFHTYDQTKNMVRVVISIGENTHSKIVHIKKISSLISCATYGEMLYLKHEGGFSKATYLEAIDFTDVVRFASSWEYGYDKHKDNIPKTGLTFLGFTRYESSNAIRYGYYQPEDKVVSIGVYGQIVERYDPIKWLESYWVHNKKDLELKLNKLRGIDFQQKFYVRGVVEVPIYTVVYAESEEEANEIAQKRRLSAGIKKEESFIFEDVVSTRVGSYPKKIKNVEKDRTM